MRSVLTPKDLAMNKPVTPGWYPFEITKVSEEVTKGTADKPSDGSMNVIYEFTAIDGPDNVKGRSFRKYFNEKALGFGERLWLVLFPETFKKDVGGELNSEMFASTVGKQVKGYLKQDGKYANLEDFQPLS